LGYILKFIFLDISSTTRRTFALQDTLKQMSRPNAESAAISMQDIWMASTNKWVVYYRNPIEETQAPGLSFQDFYDILHHQRDKPRTKIAKLSPYDTRKFSTHRVNILQSIISSVQAIFFDSSDPEDARLMDLFTFSKQVDTKEFTVGACKYLDICMSCLEVPDYEERKDLYCSCIVADFYVASDDHPDSENTINFFIYQGLFHLFETRTKLWESVSAMKIMLKSSKKNESFSASSSVDQSAVSYTSSSLSNSSAAHPLICQQQINVAESRQPTGFDENKPAAPVKTCTESLLSQETTREDSQLAAQNKAVDVSPSTINSSPLSTIHVKDKKKHMPTFYLPQENDNSNSQSQDNVTCIRAVYHDEIFESKLSDQFLSHIITKSDVFAILTRQVRTSGLEYGHDAEFSAQQDALMVNIWLSFSLGSGRSPIKESYKLQFNRFGNRSQHNQTLIKPCQSSTNLVFLQTQNLELQETVNTLKRSNDILESENKRLKTLHENMRQKITHLEAASLVALREHEETISAIEQLYSTVKLPRKATTSN
jgi:hypothetical protein